MTESEEADYDGEWYAFDDGATINEDGEYGVILQDEELGYDDDPEAADARLTLEQGRAENLGFFLTATLYGWLFVTVKRPKAQEANMAYEAMKSDLSQMAQLIPYEEDGKKRIEQKAQAMMEAVAAFEKKYEYNRPPAPQ